MEENKNPEEKNLLEDEASINRYAGFTPPPLQEKKKSKKLLFIIIIIVLGLAGFLMIRSNSLLKQNTEPTPSPQAIQTPQPTPAAILIRSDWSLEVLNGSGTSGLAKQIALKLQDLGYQVVKTGNADRDYDKTQILIKKELLEKADLVIADIKDVIKIASVAGELTEGTASARIIIGKDI